MTEENKGWRPFEYLSERDGHLQYKLSYTTTHLDKLFLNALPTVTRISSLKITGDGVTSVDPSPIWTMIGRNESLTRLSLRHMRLTSIRGLCDVLSTNTSLREVSLRSNMTHDVDLAEGSFGKMLMTNTTLLTLDLSNNPITSFSQLYEGMIHNTTLQRVVLDNLNLERDVDLIGQMIVRNSTLTDLSLSIYTFDHRSFRKRFEPYVRHNASLVAMVAPTRGFAVYISRNKHNARMKKVTLYELMFPRCMFLLNMTSG